MILPDWMIRERGMIEPFEERSVHADTGLSYGLGPGGYDFRIKQNRTLCKGDFCIASTIERFAIPNDVMPFVVDKSTLARMGISIFNTCAEAGWRGWLTVEIVCHAPGPIHLLAGQPIGQMVFHQMMAPAEKVYSGKYQDQPDEPVAALFERPLSKPPLPRNGVL